jgi:YD repeat-containing protein
MSYDSRNRLSSKAVPANSNAAAVTYSYAYDYSNRTLSVQASTDSAAYAYAYDTAGRQLSETRPDGKEVSWTLDADGNRSQFNGGWSDEYATSYSYDALNRLTDIYEVSGGLHVAHYAYDTLSERTALTYANAASVLYAFDPASVLTGVRGNWGQSAKARLRSTRRSPGVR